MKYECTDCKKAFQHAARFSHFLEPKDLQKDEDTTITVGDTIETYRCPYCHSLNIQEQPPLAVEQPKMLDMVECEVTQVKSYLDKGYVVLDRYAKAIRLALYDAPPASQPTTEAP